MREKFYESLTYLFIKTIDPYKFLMWLRLMILLTKIYIHEPDHLFPRYYDNLLIHLIFLGLCYCWCILWELSRRNIQKCHTYYTWIVTANSSVGLAIYWRFEKEQLNCSSLWPQRHMPRSSEDYNKYLFLLILKMPKHKILPL